MLLTQSIKSNTIDVCRKPLVSYLILSVSEPNRTNLIQAKLLLAAVTRAEPHTLKTLVTHDCHMTICTCLTPPWTAREKAELHTLKNKRVAPLPKVHL